MKNGKVCDKKIFSSLEYLRVRWNLCSPICNDGSSEHWQSVPRLCSKVLSLTTGSLAITPWLAIWILLFLLILIFSQDDIDPHKYIEHSDYFHPDVEYWPPVPGPVVLLVHPRESHIFTGSMLMLMCIDCSPPIARVSDQNISVKNMFTDVSRPGGRRSCKSV